MTYIILPDRTGMEERMHMMDEDAKYEVSCDNDAEHTALVSAGMIKTGHLAVKKIPKLYVASRCVFNCAYCGCRNSRDDRRDYCNDPRELAKTAVDEARANGNGVFITSSIYKDPDHTQEMIAECVMHMRKIHMFKGYIHAKIMPGADKLLIEKTGKYADRLSINIEVANSSGYKKIAKQKNKKNILAPMKDISDLIKQARHENRTFASSQTTQLMAGSTQEDDRTIMNLSGALYGRYGLKRVYYTAYHYTHAAIGYENECLSYTVTPFWRMARLYQADRLIKLYGFSTDDVTPLSCPNLECDIDPKSSWALRNLDIFPVEVNKADHETLIRIPGIGLTYAKRIIEARKHCIVTHDLLKKMRVSLKRSNYFITCNGRYKGGNALFSADLKERLRTPPKDITISNTLLLDCDE